MHLSKKKLSETKYPVKIIVIMYHEYNKFYAQSAKLINIVYLYKIKYYDV